MISKDEYFGDKPHTEAQELLALDLLSRVETLSQEFCEATKLEPEINPHTGSEVSGSEHGQGDGGFRLQDSATGRAKSSHKEARGVDKSDMEDALDRWLDKFEDGFGGNSMLEKHGLYREHPASTPGWCHLTTRQPPSGKRTFYP